MYCTLSSTDGFSGLLADSKCSLNKLGGILAQVAVVTDVTCAKKPPLKPICRISGSADLVWGAQRGNLIISIVCEKINRLFFCVSFFF